MRSIGIDRSNIFLVLIVAVLVAVGVAAWFHFQVDTVESALKQDSIVKVLFVLEDKGKPISSYVMVFYPVTKRAALFDIPSDTGLIIKSLGRVDAISALYRTRDQKPYRQQISSLLAVDVPLEISMNLDGLSRLVDLLDGLELFVPNAVELVDRTPPVLFPQGSSTFDGSKVVTFVTYENPDEGNSDLVARRQKEFLALIKKMGERSAYLSRGDAFPMFRRDIRTNMDSGGLKRLLSMLGDIDTDRMSPNRLQGTYKEVDGKDLLFAHYDGNLFRDIVKQNLNALVDASGTGIGERVFSLEILNGTAITGLGKRAAALYESFGYDVLSIKNAQNDAVEKTAVFDRISNDEVAKNVSAVIRCANTVEGSPDGTSDDSTVDFSILLGKDFDGRYCSP